VTLLSDAAASEEAFKALAPGHGILHLATHGFFLGGRCDSALDDSIAGENPLLLSGLALAGANHRGAAGPDEEDGILTAEEIAALDLTGVRWAVLSACDTGVGHVRAGEGVFGLRRAFRVAGAGTLIMSLWSVDDEAAREWMRALYESRLSGLGTSEAVRQASLSMIEARRHAGETTHPFFWGAFVAAGDWR
jgi:CHAT domain-containing protein